MVLFEEYSLLFESHRYVAEYFISSIQGKYCPHFYRKHFHVQCQQNSLKSANNHGETVLFTLTNKCYRAGIRPHNFSNIG